MRRRDQGAEDCVGRPCAPMNHPSQWDSRRGTLTYGILLPTLCRPAISPPCALGPWADVRHIVRKIVRRGLKPIPPKRAISLRLDREALEWFKAQGEGYQTRMKAVLCAFRDAPT